MEFIFLSDSNNFKYDEESHDFWLGGKAIFFGRFRQLKVLSITPERLYFLCPIYHYATAQNVEKRLGAKVTGSLWVFNRIDPKDDKYHYALKYDGAEILELE